MKQSQTKIKAKKVLPKQQRKLREWVMFRKDRTTTAIHVLLSGKLAVARAYLSKTDARKFSQEAGQSIAFNRLKCFLKVFRRNRRKILYVTKYESQRGKTRKHGHVLFEVVSPAELKPEERKFFNKEIRPNFQVYNKE